VQSVGVVARINTNTGIIVVNMQGRMTRDVDNLVKNITIVSGSGGWTSYPPAADTDTARGNALTTAMAAMVSGDYLVAPPGNYYMATMSNPIRTGCHYKFNGSKLYIDASSAGGAFTNWLFNSENNTAKSDWSFIGPLTIDGASRAGKTAIVSQNGSGGIFRDIKVTNWADRGFWLPAGTGYNRMTNCEAKGCGKGFEFASQYWMVVGTIAETCTTGFYISGGNNQFAACMANTNTTGVHLFPGTNSGHGTWSGGSINHNVTTGVKVSTGLILGFVFTGTQLFANGTGGLNLGGAGVIFDSCEIDCPITCSEAQQGPHFIRGCYMPQTSTTLGTLTAAQRKLIKLTDNYSPTVRFVSDDIFTTYATDVAAGTGGVLQGELWQQTTTGAVFVKL